MRIGIIGDGERAEARRQSLNTLPDVAFAGTLASDACEVAASSGISSPLDVFLRPLDVVFIAVPTALHFVAAQAATKQGVHVFLEWPPATAVRECEALARLAEEARVEIGVSRPWRSLPPLKTWRTTYRASLLSLQLGYPATPPAWPSWLADALDLCTLLARSANIQRIDAQAVRQNAAWPQTVAFGLRFHNGVYAQVHIRRTAPYEGTLYLAGREEEHILALPSPHTPSLLTAEAQAFVQAVAQQKPAPTSILDGLHLMRLTERLMTKLR